MIQAMFLSFVDYSYHLPVFVLFAKIVSAVVVFIIIIIIIISKNRFSIRMSLIICKYGVTNVVHRQNKKRKKMLRSSAFLTGVRVSGTVYFSSIHRQIQPYFFHSVLKVSFSLNEFRVGDIISFLVVIFFFVKTVFSVSILRM